MEPKRPPVVTYPLTRDAFLAEMLRSPHTVRTYERGINLFVGNHKRAPYFSPPPLTDLDVAHRPILVQYAQWLLEARGLAPTTVKLYLVAVRRWFQWMAVNDYLPPAFPLEKALWALGDALRGRIFKTTHRPPEPPPGIEETITFYDDITVTFNPGKPDATRREALTIFRNRALMHVLAETGGRVSEVLQLRVGDFPEAAFAGGVWRVRVRGKGGHVYPLRFLDALPFARDYLAHGRADAGDDAPLFVCHSKRYDGRPMSRQAVWRVVDVARDGLRLGRIHPHDFRHYVASKLVNAGVSLDVVQNYLGHQSVETTRAYYAHTREARVDEAARRLSE